MKTTNEQLLKTWANMNSKLKVEFEEKDVEIIAIILKGLKDQGIGNENLIFARLMILWNRMHNETNKIKQDATINSSDVNK